MGKLKNKIKSKKQNREEKLEAKRISVSGEGSSDLVAALIIFASKTANFKIMFLGFVPFSDVQRSRFLRPYSRAEEYAREPTGASE